MTEILRDPKRPITFRPREDGPTYLLRVPAVADRARYRHAARAEGARFWPQLQLAALARTAVAKLLDGQPEALGEANAALDAYTARLEAALERRKTDQSEAAIGEYRAAIAFPADLAEILTATADRDRALAAAFADNGVYWLIAGTVAARLFLVGWDGLGEFRRDLRGPDEATLAQIPSGDFEAMALEIEGRLEPSEARLGNSGSPSSSPPAETDSSSAGKNTRRKAPSPDETATV